MGRNLKQGDLMLTRLNQQLKATERMLNIIENIELKHVKKLIEVKL